MDQCKYPNSPQGAAKLFTNNPNNECPPAVIGMKNQNLFLQESESDIAFWIPHKTGSGNWNQRVPFEIRDAKRPQA
ncbi:unnamed protein product [Bursaphelenchus xylophilus]|uniref:(pine wood nematode) hypothetical protein n=1 Tax=Bursaphelenchus xylophilus TaxID=6326 RepID=A0A1I7RK77_BURXY|nr:unnamed protein product [Bursaphelenchus xylophilus]CAG9131443.1 unnamed protein product [Bursaphelenchus xylophilus]